MLRVSLASVKHYQTRAAYTFMNLLANFGGFNFAITMIPGFLLSFYTHKFLESSIAHEMPYKRKKAG